MVDGAEASGVATVGEINAGGGGAEDVDHRLVPLGDGLMQRSVAVGILRFILINLTTFVFSLSIKFLETLRL